MWLPAAVTSWRRADLTASKGNGRQGGRWYSLPFNLRWERDSDGNPGSSLFGVILVRCGAGLRLATASCLNGSLHV